ncbi:MAG: PHP domain-containing protein, partial [Planctomycetes bacterium]|nr:PHP domain-containing protein [Planctomycetota bacterium]
MLAAEGGFHWYKGNLHTHTLWSDGDDYPEMVALWYKDNGYDFLAFTDHNTLLRKE